MLHSQLKELIDRVRAVFQHEIKQASDKQEAAIAKESYSRQEKEREIGAVIARAINTASDSVPDYEKSQRQKEHNLQWGMFGVTLFAAVAAAFAAIGAFYYAGIAKSQLCEMRETNRLTRDALGKSDTALNQTLGKMQGQIDVAQNTLTEVQRQKRLDQRPWLKFLIGNESAGDSNKWPASIAVKQPIIVPARFQNFGRTPARNVRGFVVLQIVDAGKEADLPEKNEAPAILPLGIKRPPGMKPLKKILNSAIFLQSLINPGSYSDVFPIFRPAKIARDKWGVAPEISAPTEDEYEAVMITRTAYMAAWGEVWYDDIFGVEHWTKFCSDNHQLSHPKKCVQYNDVDNNSDPPK